MSITKKYFGFLALLLVAVFTMSSTSYAMYEFEDALDEKEFEAMTTNFEEDLDEWEDKFNNEMKEFEDELEKSLDELEDLLEYKIDAVMKGAMRHEDARNYIKDALYRALKDGAIDEEEFKELLHEFDEETRDAPDDRMETHQAPRGDLPQLKIEEDGRERVFVWTKADEEDFRYYKLVYSTRNEKPRYPQDKTMFISDDVDENEVAMSGKEGYWAICHVYEGFYASGEKDDSYVLCSHGIKVAADGSYSQPDTKMHSDLMEKRMRMKEELNEAGENFRDEMNEMREEMMDEFAENFDPDMNGDGEVDEFEEMIEACLNEYDFKMHYCQKAVRGDLRDEWKNFDEDDEDFVFDFEPEEFEHMRHFGGDFNPRMFEGLEDESFFDDFDPDFFNHIDIDEIPEDMFGKVDFAKFDKMDPELFERIQRDAPERLMELPKKVRKAAEFMLDDLPEDLLEEFGFVGDEAEKVRKLMKAVNKQKREEIANVLDDIDQTIRDEMMDFQDQFEEEVSGFMEYLPNVPQQARENFVKHKKNFLEHAKKMEEKFVDKKGQFDAPTETLLEEFQNVVENYNFVGDSAEELQGLVDTFLEEVDTFSDEEIKETLRDLHEEMKRLREASKQDKFAQGIIPFRDTDDDQWFTTFVSEAASNGVIGGYKDENGNALGEFRPGNKVTIAEAIKMSAANAGLEESDSAPANEVAQNHWVAGWMKAAEDAEMSVDVADVNKEATRGDVVKWAIESFGIVPPAAESSSFSDVQMNDPNVDYIEYAKQMGIISGDGDTGAFRPQDGIIRAEVAKILGSAAEVFSQ